MGSLGDQLRAIAAEVDALEAAGVPVAGDEPAPAVVDEPAAPEPGFAETPAGSAPIDELVDVGSSASDEPGAGLPAVAPAAPAGQHDPAPEPVVGIPDDEVDDEAAEGEPDGAAAATSSPSATEGL